MEIHKKHFIYIYLIIVVASIITTYNFVNYNNLEKHINHQNNHLKENINLVEKEIDKFQQETQSNFQKINENIDKLEEMIVNQNKSNQESE
ncbi:hypothetical protein C6B37_01980 [Candidatus Phytoplasma phoenicium]|uniref:Uncharacterized protein n=1 Tax=Candidatus Phytoplasma phoenicium TaxID=198422 RepID=A0A2S8NU20_9MOLU|nr:hypothetical protein C6B37_01980 [Candidatus Phytoplasma phoenicium]BDU62108.1 hypothetical protein [Candidatus Phytoplasma phoenicium]